MLISKLWMVTMLSEVLLGIGACKIENMICINVEGGVHVIKFINFQNIYVDNVVHNYRMYSLKIAM